MPDKVWEMIESLRQEMERLAFSDAVSTFANPPVEQPTLTADALHGMMRQFRRQYVPPPLRVVEVDPYPVRIQSRTHRKRRINKKWRKRYGMKTEWRQMVPTGKVFVDSARGVAYCNRGELGMFAEAT